MVLRPTDTFIDIDTNVGVYSAVMLRMKATNPAFRVYAFEPNPDTAGACAPR
jgi:hypothetical protein